MRRSLAITFIALSIAVGVYFNTVTVLPRNLGEVDTYVAAKAGKTEYVKLPRAWRPRLLATITASKFIPSTETEDGFHIATFDAIEGIALHAGTWTLILCLILGFLPNGLPAMIAVGTSIMYAYSPASRYCMLPWDIPSATFFALLLYGTVRQKEYVIILATVIGVAFKETAILGCLGMLALTKFPMRDRLKLLVIGGAGGAAMKVLMDWVVGGDIGLTPTAQIGSGFRLFHNLRELAFIIPPHGEHFEEWRLSMWNHLMFVNVGCLLLMFVIPTQSFTHMVWRYICGLIVFGLLLFGRVVEFRSFLDAMPAACYYVTTYILKDKNEYRTNVQLTE